MGVRFRRSIKIAPGVRLNVTKTGIGATFGGKGARYSVHSSRRTVGLGLPGTGTYYQKTTGGGRSGGGQRARGGSSPQAAAPVSPIQAIPKPGLFASGADRAYHSGLLSYLDNDSAAALVSFEKVIASDRVAMSAHLFAGVAASAIGDSPRWIAHLEAVVGSQTALPDRYQAKFMPASVFNLTLSVRITDSILARPDFGNWPPYSPWWRRTNPPAGSRKRSGWCSRSTRSSQMTSSFGFLSAICSSPTGTTRP